MNKELGIILNGFFLFFIAVAGNFLAPLFGCQLQKLLMENLFIKYVMAILIIYFSILMYDKSKHPKLIWIHTMQIFLLFIIFNKQSKYFIIITLLLLFILLNLINLNEYAKINKKYTYNFDLYINLIFYIILIVNAIGFIFYFIKKYKKYKYKNFDLIKFLFYNINCNF